MCFQSSGAQPFKYLPMKTKQDSGRTIKSLWCQETLEYTQNIFGSTRVGLFPSPPQSTMGSRAFSRSAPRPWNSLPSSIHIIDSLPLFKFSSKLICSKQPTLSNCVLSYFIVFYYLLLIILLCVAFVCLWHLFHSCKVSLKVENGSCQFNCLQSQTGCTCTLLHVNPPLHPSEQLPYHYCYKQREATDPAPNSKHNATSEQKTYANGTKHVHNHNKCERWLK